MCNTKQTIINSWMICNTSTLTCFIHVSQTIFTLLKLFIKSHFSSNSQVWIFSSTKGAKTSTQVWLRFSWRSSVQSNVGLNLNVNLCFMPAQFFLCMMQKYSWPQTIQDSQVPSIATTHFWPMVVATSMPMRMLEWLTLPMCSHLMTLTTIISLELMELSNISKWFWNDHIRVFLPNTLLLGAVVCWVCILYLSWNLKCYFYMNLMIMCNLPVIFKNAFEWSSYKFNVDCRYCTQLWLMPDDMVKLFRVHLLVKCMEHAV